MHWLEQHFDSETLEEFKETLIDADAREIGDVTTIDDVRAKELQNVFHIELGERVLTADDICHWRNVLAGEIIERNRLRRRTRSKPDEDLDPSITHVGTGAKSFLQFFEIVQMTIMPLGMVILIPVILILMENGDLGMRPSSNLATTLSIILGVQLVLAMRALYVGHLMRKKKPRAIQAAKRWLLWTLLCTAIPMTLYTLAGGDISIAFASLVLWFLLCYGYLQFSAAVALKFSDHREPLFGRVKK